MIKIAVPGLSFLQDCRLEIGDNGVNISDETLRKGIIETNTIRGFITFQDMSSADGIKRNLGLGEFEYEVAGSIVEPLGFNPYEYYAPREQD